VIDRSVAPSGWSHWIVVNLPRSTTVLARGVSNLPAGSIQIQTNFGDAQYAGPCPPPGSGVHRYEFTVWALKAAAPAIASDEAATSVMQKLQSVTIEKSSVAATFQR
jgi:Raf kinase inhibitor-like YbhB/YbcL family protein